MLEDNVQIEQEQSEVFEVKHEEPVQPQQSGMAENDKWALIAFIVAVAAFSCDLIGISGGVGGILIGMIAVVCGIVALVFNRKAVNVIKNPFRVFKRITKPVAIIDIIGGAIIIGLSIILLILEALEAIVEEAGA